MGKINVVIDRPLGSVHPEHNDMIYPINYGYVEGVIAPDGEYQDAYVLGVSKPINQFEGDLIAIIKRSDDVEGKWVVSNKRYTKEEIYEQVKFTEQYFDSEIILGFFYLSRGNHKSSCQHVRIRINYWSNVGKTAGKMPPFRL